MQVELSPLLTMKEAMAYLRISRSTLYRLMWSGQLTGHKVGTGWRYYVDDVQRLLGEPTLPAHEIPDTITDATMQQV